MPKYKVTIIESWSGWVEVEAENEEKAKEIAYDVVETQYDETVDVIVNEIPEPDIRYKKSKCKRKNRIVRTHTINSTRGE